jgi:hypothetical protein
MPTTNETLLQVVVRGSPSKVQTGCFVYSKDLITDQFSLLGRTDWRGALAIQAPKDSVRVLPESLRLQRIAALRQAQKDSLARYQAEYEQASKQAQAEGLEQPKFDPPASINQPDDQDSSDSQIALNQPLMQIYVKNGDTVLAKLPMVPGLNGQVIAELPDDSLRLRAEALLRGFEGEILDLIGLRNLLMAKVKLHLKAGRVAKATESIDEMRGLKDFNRMNDDLSELERRILEQAGESVPPGTKARIDRMFRATRDLLQKFMQEDIVSLSTDLVRQAAVAEGTASATRADS